MRENDPKGIHVLSEIRDTTYRGKDIESKSLSDAPKIDFKESDTTQQYNKTLNQQNFITIPSGNGAWLRLSNLSEDQKIEIIKTGFQLNQEGKVSLKKYYESGEEYSLFQLKGYRMKYESIRRTKLYQQLKK